MSAVTQQLILAADGNFGHMEWGAGGWVLMAIGMVVFWGLVIFGVVWLVRTLTHPGHHVVAQHPPNPLEILDRGLAEGTISIEEYEKRRRLLSGSSPGG
jgi:putative membrane protein